MEQNRKDEVIRVFGNKLRVRVCGICIENNQILLVKHPFIGDQDFFWAPPGGGLQFDESAEECLIREFKEEARVGIKVKKYLFMHEFISDTLHAIELFFQVEIISGTPSKGHDPEVDFELIEAIQFWDMENIKQLPVSQFHQIFQLAQSVDQLLALTGYFRTDLRKIS